MFETYYVTAENSGPKYDRKQYNNGTNKFSFIWFLKPRKRAGELDVVDRHQKTVKT